LAKILKARIASGLIANFMKTSAALKFDFTRNKYPAIPKVFEGLVCGPISREELPYTISPFERLLKYIKNKNYVSALNAADSVALEVAEGKHDDITLKSLLEHCVKERYQKGYDQDLEIAYRMILGQKALRSGFHFEAIEHFSELFLLEQGPIVPSVALVGEGQVGFSDGKPMGTHNILQCSVVILRENKSGKAALMHVNTNSAESEVRGTINSFVAKFSEDIDSTFSARLVGSRFNGYADDGSAQNLTKVANSLPSNITIVSADVWESSIPSSIVYHPATDYLFHGVGVETDMKASILQRASAYIDLHRLASPGRSLLETMPVAFDFLQDKKITEFSTDPIPKKLIPSCAEYGERFDDVASKIFSAMRDRRSNTASNRNFFLMRCLIDSYWLSLGKLSEKSAEKQDAADFLPGSDPRAPKYAKTCQQSLLRD
jgi:hypothetical protein